MHLSKALLKVVIEISFLRKYDKNFSTVEKSTKSLVCPIATSGLYEYGFFFIFLYYFIYHASEFIYCHTTKNQTLEGNLKRMKS